LRPLELFGIVIWMTAQSPLPILITFDGEARSGKGTIVQAAKDYLRDTAGYKVMLIDAGQVFRVLVVAASQAGIDLDNPDAIDAFLGDDKNVQDCMQLVKDVYRMKKEERDQLLYTSEVGHNSAKIGARPLSQYFKDELLRTWLKDARSEGFEVVLLDGRALEEVGSGLEADGLCDFRLGLYFICDPITGARRTLGYASRSYDELDDAEKTAVDELVAQIKVRNEADQKRQVQTLVRPAGVAISHLPDIKEPINVTDRPMYLIDTSNDMSKQEMSAPVLSLIMRHLQ
jgi:cytidylate kinase